MRLLLWKTAQLKKEEGATGNKSILWLLHKIHDLFMTAQEWEIPFKLPNTFKCITAF